MTELRTCANCERDYPMTAEYFCRKWRRLSTWCKRCEVRYDKQQKAIVESVIRNDRIKESPFVCVYCSEVYCISKLINVNGCELKCPCCNGDYTEVAIHNIDFETGKLVNRSKPRAYVQLYDNQHGIVQILSAEDNSAITRAQIRAQRLRKPDSQLNGNARRRARKRSAETDTKPFDVKGQFKRQKGRCYYCGDRLGKYHIDHVIPLSRGGSDLAENKVLTCPHCNLEKHNKLPHEWITGGRLL